MRVLETAASSRSSPSLFFFLMPRPPPTSTLFPYTTLFRSDVGVVLLAPGQSAGRPVAQLPTSNLLGDRKSTRLNSSHVATSYAVFCLKKKKTAGRRSPDGASGQI